MSDDGKVTAAAELAESRRLAEAVEGDDPRFGAVAAQLSTAAAVRALALATLTVARRT